MFMPVYILYIEVYAKFQYTTAKNEIRRQTALHENTNGRQNKTTNRERERERAGVHKQSSEKDDAHDG